MYNLLDGLTVIEASSFVASPTAGLYCAQFGAEVIRVDQVGGGPDYRRWPVTEGNDSLYWENLNRAKKSVALDLSKPEGRELLQALVRATGQFITNFPAEGFLSHAKLAEGRADLVTVRVMGWADGAPALDYTVNNAVGYPMLTGPGPEPVNHVLPAWDLLSGAYAAFALLAALRRRHATGAGTEVRIPLPAGSQIVVDTQRFWHAVWHRGNAPRYSLITSWTSGPELDAYIERHNGVASVPSAPLDQALIDAAQAELARRLEERRHMLEAQGWLDDSEDDPASAQGRGLSGTEA